VAQDPSELGPDNDPLPLGPDTTQLHLQDNPNARSHHVVHRSGWALLVSQRHVTLGSNPAQGQAAQAPGVPTWWCRSGSRPRQGKPAPAPHGARFDLAQG